MRAEVPDQYLVGVQGLKKIDSETSQRFVCCSNDVINLKLVQEEDDLFTEEGYFHPTYTNQAIIC